MPVAVTVNHEFDHGQVLEIVGTLVFSGNYATGGDTVNFAGLVKSSRPPIDVRIEGESGFIYRFDIGAGIDNGKAKVFGQEPTSATTGVIAASELAAAAYPAGITGDTVRFRALFEKFL